MYYETSRIQFDFKGQEETWRTNIFRIPGAALGTRRKDINEIHYKHPIVAYKHKIKITINSKRIKSGDAQNFDA